MLGSFADAVNFPILMSNAHISGEALLRDVTQKPAVIERSDQKIGWIGETLQDTDELAIPGPNVAFINPFKAVQGEVNKLTVMGINKIIVLSYSDFVVDQAVVAKTRGVGVILDYL